MTKTHLITLVAIVILCFASFGQVFALDNYSHPADCWLENMSGYAGPFTGTNPSTSEIFDAIRSLSAQYKVPIEIIGAVCYQESVGSLCQYGADGFVVHNLTECKSYYNGAAGYPPGLGLMQLSGVTAKGYDLNRLITDWRYNLEAGVQVLRQKYDYALSQDPLSLQTIEIANWNVLENWRYALAYYNGYQNPENPYVATVCSIIASPPSRLSGLFTGVTLTRPQDVITGFTYGKGYAVKPDGSWLYYNSSTYYDSAYTGGGSGTVPALLTNGDFEYPSLPLGTEADFSSGSSDLPGWIVGGPSESVLVLINGPGAYRPAAPSGNQQLIFNAGDTAVGAFIEQLFQTTPGASYKLSYIVGRGGPAPGTMALKAELFDSSNMLLSSLVSVAPDIANSYGTLQVIDFKAVTSSTKLRITDVSVNTISVDVLLDQVVVVSVNKPATITIATPTNPNVGQKPTGLSGHLNYWDAAQNQWVSMTAVPSTSIFDPSRPTIIITHGWNDSISNTPDSSGSDNWTMRMAKQEEAIANQNVNILAWDWQAQANPAGIPVYFQWPFFYLMPNDAAESARNGNVDGGNLAWELKLIGINPAQTQLIGHSNGGDLMGSAATTISKLMGLKIERLTTLDTPNVTIIGVNATQFIEPKNVNEVEVYYSGDRFVGGAGATVTGSNVFNGEVYPTGLHEHSYVPDWYTNLGETATIPHAPDPNVRGMNWSIVSPNRPSAWIAEDRTEQGANTGVFDTASILEQVRLAYNTPLKQMNFYSGEEYQGTHAGTVTDPVRNYVANLWGDSDGYLFKTITIPADATIMTFDMKVVTVVSGDYITLSFGDKVLFCEDITGVDSNFVTTLPIPIPDLAGQTDTLLFTLHHDTDTPGSSVLLDNITFSALLSVADLDMDGKVNFTDFALFANHWMDDTCSDPNWCDGTDFDHSGQVDIFDLVEFAKNWLSGY